MLDGFFSPDLIDLLTSQLEKTTFTNNTFAGIGSELTMDANAILYGLQLLANDDVLHGFVQRLTNCGPISSFAGRIYRIEPSPEVAFAWHDDFDDGDRLIGMSVNLGSPAFQGGRFQLRRRRHAEIIADIANTGVGDALLFRISPDLQHRVTPIEGTIPRTSFVGWFARTTRRFPWSRLVGMVEK